MFDDRRKVFGRKVKKKKCRSKTKWSESKDYNRNKSDFVY